MKQTVDKTQYFQLCELVENISDPTEALVQTAISYMFDDFIQWESQGVFRREKSFVPDQVC